MSTRAFDLSQAANNWITVLPDLTTLPSPGDVMAATTVTGGVVTTKFNPPTGGGGPFLPLSGGTVSPGPLMIGNGTGTPALTINGAAATNKGINWQNAGTNRWRFITDASENLALYAYGAGGGFINTAVSFDPLAQLATFSFQVTANNYSAPISGGVAGCTFSAHNTGTNAAYGSLVQYYSAAGGNGFDTGFGVTVSYDTVFQAGINPALEAIWIMVESPNDATHSWGCNVGEINLINRGPDVGFKRDRSLAGNSTGGLLFVPEAGSITGAGDGTNVGYGFAVCHSSNTNLTTGQHPKMYIGFNVEPNANVGLTGRAFYATGDITGTASQYPYGPMQLEGTWLHGIDHTLATYTDGYAQTMMVPQALRWILGGTTASPAGAVTIAATAGGGLTVATNGLAAPINLQGYLVSPVSIGNGTGLQGLYLNGASGQNTGINWETAGNTRWRFITDASDNLALYAYNASGGFTGTVWGISPTYFQVGVDLYAARVGFNGATPGAKPTVTGAKAGNAALASLLTALASYGLVTDSST